MKIDHAAAYEAALAAHETAPTAETARAVADATVVAIAANVGQLAALLDADAVVELQEYAFALGLRSHEKK